MTAIPTREEALALLHEYTSSESLRNHALAVEAGMREMARRRGGDEHLWGVIGLLHDLDYERWPDPSEHAKQTAAILRAQGWAEEIVLPILGHNPVHGQARDTDAARVLYAIDELCGFVHACALVRPGRNIGTLEPPSVVKKMKDKAFARQVDRQCIREGAAELGIELPELCGAIIAALRGIAPQLGLTATA
jgi:putative nucleotidyltransferase with HDIG domain